MTPLHEELSGKMPTAASSGRLPNFLYIGTSKAGSTWLYRVLADHPDVFMAPEKGTYFFDSHFERGYDWYLQQFRRVNDEKIVGEISHGYLHSPDAAARIAERMPQVKLMVCLREPTDRAFSAYLDSVKNGRFSGSFEEALEENTSLIERGCYASCIERYLDRFGREQLHVQAFDDLKSDPQQCADELFRFLDVPTRILTEGDRKKAMPAALPRSKVAMQIAKSAARKLGRVGLKTVRGRLKRSSLVRNVLYRPLSDAERPTMNPATRDRLKDRFRDEVVKLGALVGTSLAARWGYQ
jgi:hypothetical protein